MMQLKNLFIEVYNNKHITTWQILFPISVYAQIWKKEEGKDEGMDLQSKINIFFLKLSNKLDYHNNRSMDHILNWEKIPSNKQFNLSKVMIIHVQASWLKCCYYFLLHRGTNKHLL